MKRLKWLATSVLAFTPFLAAQETGSLRTKPRPQAYAFFAGTNSLGDWTNLMAFGGGGEGFVYKGFAAGGEGAYLFSPSRFLGGMGLVSVNGSYHFTQIGDGRLVPFVTAGYSLAFREGTVSMPNYGGGVTYWFRPRIGARVEVRNHQHSDASLVTFRVGLSFR